MKAAVILQPPTVPLSDDGLLANGWSGPSSHNLSMQA